MFTYPYYTTPQYSFQPIYSTQNQQSIPMYLPQQNNFMYVQPIPNYQQSYQQTSQPIQQTYSINNQTKPNEVVISSDFFQPPQQPLKETNQLYLNTLFMPSLMESAVDNFAYFEDQSVTKPFKDHSYTPSISTVCRYVLTPSDKKYVPKYSYSSDELYMRVLVDYSTRLKNKYPYPIQRAIIKTSSQGEKICIDRILKIDNDVVHNNFLSFIVSFNKVSYNEVACGAVPIGPNKIKIKVSVTLTIKDIFRLLEIKDINAVMAIENSSTLFCMDDRLVESEYLYDCITHNRIPEFTIIPFSYCFYKPLPLNKFGNLVNYSNVELPVCALIKEPFTFIINTVYYNTHVTDEIHVRCVLRCGDQTLSCPMEKVSFKPVVITSPLSSNDEKYIYKFSIDEKVDSNLRICDIPLDCEIILIVFIGQKRIGCASVKVFNAWGVLKCGVQLVHLEEGKRPIGNGLVSGPIVELDFGSTRAAYHIEGVEDSKLMNIQKELDTFESVKNREEFETMIKMDELKEYEDKVPQPINKMIIDGVDIFQMLRSPSFITRSPPDYIKRALIEQMENVPAEFIGQIAHSIDWTDHLQVARFVKYLWTQQIKPLDALMLLGYRCPYRAVRAYCVSVLDKQPDNVLQFYAIHLSEALRYEEGLTPLTDFLLRRSIASPATVGYSLFKMIIGDTSMTKRSIQHSRFIEALLSADPVFASQMTKECEFALNVQTVNSTLIRMDSEKRQIYRSALLKSISVAVPIPFKPGVIGGLSCEKSKVYTSNAVPLLIDFSGYKMIFKLGDDLRQDCLILRAFKLFDNLWRMNGMDWRMTTFRVISTGNTAGYIEFVRDSRSIGSIHNDSKIPGVYKITAIYDWIKNNKTAPLGQCIENFYRSCVGYCVASYVLGLADRHNDNLMVDKSGHFLHIDFAHFLGNKLKVAGVINREPAPFVLTESMIYVFAGERGTERYKVKYREFCDDCVRAYHVLRQNASLIVSFFTNMISSKLSQLNEIKDAEYLFTSLQLGKQDSLSDLEFVKLIHDSLNSEQTNMNFFIHSLVQKTKK
ncbi:hypothetical protein ENUP19_0009G0058 [Entamoeba nuttalli]|uniref:Phosphatidylinositol-4,5-bisphosphate 3-kinase, putative n=2 Tax=Entamoeba nuttalli TaxID=412467 RepID=K2GYF7_ENTNP|nr:phosphatidylinositol-4,5-bisphosphate 3-kinase, putative [Entamoeba nuttalli P19]EKE38867.1 phosphatidylinositol-4,5-bisphosphate 3-kinase, putative [Entamoeba nuttalli P19]|eukprot:XP_008858803.1 phosphatidylinositol-4,5-bisphosphate 3-kinase, putative [Entamoeba nuttalli P19]